MLLTQKARPALRQRRGVNDTAKLPCWALDITLISSSRVTKKLNKGDVWVKSMPRHNSFFHYILHKQDLVLPQTTHFQFYYLLLVKYNVAICGGFLVEWPPRIVVVVSTVWEVWATSVKRGFPLGNQGPILGRNGRSPCDDCGMLSRDRRWISRPAADRIVSRRVQILREERFTVS